MASYMQGIDIASYQSGIDLSTVISKNSLGFVVVKSSEGASYTNPYFSKHAKATVNAGACLGAYHYISGTGATKEMQHFVDAAGDYIGTALFALDWESGSNSAWNSTSYLEDCIEAFISLTGVKPLVYVSKSYMSSVSSVASNHDCGLWIAQYANNNSTGLQSSPWNEDAYSCAMRQYSSHGSLTGYSGSLDLDKFYGTSSAWSKYATASGTVSSSSSSSSGSSSSSSSSTLTVDGYWGKATTKRLQQVLGTTVDSIVSSQSEYWESSCPGCTTGWEWVSSSSAVGSQVITAMQKKLGVTADGLIGKNTINALIKRYQSTSGATQDGTISSPSLTVKAMQKKLNSGTF